MSKRKNHISGDISWDRVRAIFGNPVAPSEVWERQFDYNDDDLKRIASTPIKEINRNDLWYYYHDLAYVELQPELFVYLFPVCLMEWHDTLMRNEACSQGDSEFHYGLWKGQVFQRMLTPSQQLEVVGFFRDSFLKRLDVEPLTVEPSPSNHPFRWICRFNSLGFIIPDIGFLWEPWWNMETRGRAVAVLKYCSGFVYYEGEHRVFGLEVKDRGCFGPLLWENDSFLHDQSWQETNVRFIRETLTFDYLRKSVDEASKRLSKEPEHELAERLSVDLTSNRDLVESRLSELPRLLAGEQLSDSGGWSI